MQHRNPVNLFFLYLALLVIAIVIAGAAAAWFVLYAFAALQSFVIALSFILEVFVRSGAMT